MAECRLAAAKRQKAAAEVKAVQNEQDAAAPSMAESARKVAEVDVEATRARHEEEEALRAAKEADERASAAIKELEAAERQARTASRAAEKALERELARERKRIEVPDDLKVLAGVTPTVENLVRYGLFGPLVYSGFDGGQPESSYDGPWNFSTGNRWSINTMTIYHKPFPGLSDVVYTYPSTCIVPFYAGYEKTEKFNPEDGYTSPLEMPLSEAYKRGYDFFNGYGFIGLGNKEPEFDETCNVNQPWNCGKYITFHPSSETDYVAQCNGAISEEEQADLFANGTYAFPHVFAQELKWSAPANAQPYVEEGKGDYFVVYKPKTVGITPLYPKTTTLELVTNTASPRTDATFFGKERCNFYEKQIAVEAFEYIFSWPNCHPCDIFKQNSPFFCERHVEKTWLNIFALSISNTLFVMGILITWAPLVLRVFLGKYG